MKQPKKTNQSLSQKEIEQPQREIVSRRELLKAVTAAGGAVFACQTLPAKWTRPVVEAGVLPVHAQTSPPPPLATGLTILNANWVNTGVNDCNLPPFGTGSSFEITFDYDDRSGQVTKKSSLVLYEATTPIAPGTPLDEFSLEEGFVHVTGDPFRGTVTFPWCQVFGSGETVEFTLSLMNDQGTVSNDLSLTVPRPVAGNSSAKTGGGVSQE